MKTEEQWAEEDEPVAYLTNHRQRLNIVINPVTYKSMPIAVEWEMPLYAKPQAKEWVGLTDQDMNNPKTHNLDFILGARWAEEILKERNK